MPHFYSWTLYGHPEDSPAPDQWDAYASTVFEDFMNELQALIRQGPSASSRVEAMLQAYSEAPLPTSPQQRFRFWFLFGRAHILRHNWDEALTVFRYCQSITLDTTPLMQIHLLRAWAYAAQEGNQFDLALNSYERLTDLVVGMFQQGQFDFIEQDPYCFLCNMYRNQAYARLSVCAPDAARAVLENHAIPLLERSKDPFAPDIQNQDDRNWRELHMFVLWLRGIVIAWQARLSDDPKKFGNDLYLGYEDILIAIKISLLSSEGKAWTPNLHSLAAELCLMRCDLANNRIMQTMLCNMADEHLQRFQKSRQDDLTTTEGRLSAWTLEFPRYQLEVRKHVIFDTINQADHVINDLVALQQQTEAVSDPGYRLLSARCLILLGDVEVERFKFSAYEAKCHAQRANAYYQQAFDLLNRRPESGLDGLYEREVLKKREQLRPWL